MKEDFDIIITEIATDNKRSIRAHKKIGFQNIKIHSDGVEWAIVALQLSE